MATSGGSGGKFEVSGRKKKDESSGVAGTKKIEATTFEVSGRKSKDGQSLASKDRGDNGTADITKGTKAMSMGEVGGSRGNQAQTRVAYTTATLKQSLNASRSSDDEPCELRGLVLLQDKIVVSDEANYKLKVFDLTLNSMFDYKCRGMPYDIAMLDNTTIVVTFRSRYMRVLSVRDDGIEETRTINTEYCNFGVCCYGGNIYCVVTDESGSERLSQVRMYTPDGRLKRRYEYLSDGKVEFNCLQLITVNPKSGILYVTDYDKGVLALSTSGDVIAAMSPPQLTSPEGIAVDDNGHIYVCGCGSHNVMQIYPDGSNAVEILSHSTRCKYPKFVRIYGNKMLLGRCDSNIISVYELS